MTADMTTDDQIKTDTDRLNVQSVAVVDMHPMNADAPDTLSAINATKLVILPQCAGLKQTQPVT